MMQPSYPISAESARFFDFAKQHGFALLPLRAGSKAALEAGWPDNASTDPAQWRAWAAAGYNIGIHAGASRLIIVDLDVTKEGGRDGAWNRYAAWCKAHGLSAFAPHCSTGRQGMHVYFKIPDGIDAASLVGSDIAEGINVLVNRRYAVAPGSTVDGGAYALFPAVTAPHAAPDALIKHCHRTPPSAPPIAKPGQYDPKQVAELVRWLADEEQFEEYSDWVSIGMALASEYGADGLDIWRLAHDETVTPDVELAKWRSFATDPKPGGLTLATWLKRAHQKGWKGTISRTAQAIFGNAVSPVPMAGGRGEVQAAQWGPILAAVPRVERSADHVLMPDTGHPLRDAINAAIPGITTDPASYVDAHAVIQCVHPATAAACGAVTAEVLARAEAFRQETERAFLPNDFIRDAKGAIERDNPDNVAFFLTSLAIDVRYNAWTERTELKGWRWPQWTELTDAVVDVLLTRAAQTKTRFTPAVDFFWRTLRAIAFDNEQDPARDLLDRLESGWDGTARLHVWLSKACGVPADEYHQACGAVILLGMVARIRQPGVDFQLMPVFVSEKQGTAKSSLARLLALHDDWFAENVALGESPKELVLLLAGKTVVEISEMRTRGEVEAVKTMISVTHDEGRPAYGRANIKRPRRNIFVGTTNRPEFLEDPTGGRRFLPITVNGEIDLEWVRANLAQLIGEAASRLSKGADINLPRSVWDAAAQHQDAATARSSTELVLETWFGGNTPCWISSGNLVLLLRQALGRDPARGSYAHTMRRLGFASKAHRHGKDVQRAWVRGDPAANDPGIGAQLNSNGRPVLPWVADAMPIPPCPVRLPVTLLPLQDGQASQEKTT